MALIPLPRAFVPSCAEQVNDEGYLGSRNASSQQGIGHAQRAGGLGSGTVRGPAPNARVRAPACNSPIRRRLREMRPSGAEGRVGPKAPSQPLYVRTKLKLLTGEGASSMQAAWNHVAKGIWAAP